MVRCDFDIPTLRSPLIKKQRSVKQTDGCFDSQSVSLYLWSDLIPGVLQIRILSVFHKHKVSFLPCWSFIKKWLREIPQYATKKCTKCNLKLFWTDIFLLFSVYSTSLAFNNMQCSVWVWNIDPYISYYLIYLELIHYGMTRELVSQ